MVNGIINYSADLLIINIVLTLLMIFISKPGIIYKRPNNTSINNTTFIFLFILNAFHCIFAFWAADTYHIWWTFVYEKFSMEYYEQVYNWLANTTNFNYFLWRTIIWTPTLYLIYKSANKLDLITRCFAVAFVLLNIFIISNTRGALGHSMLLFGIIGFYTNKKCSFNFIISCALIYISYFFHKSMYINIIFAIIAIIPFKKKGLIISLIAFPFLVMVASKLIVLIQTEALDVAYGEGAGGIGDRTHLYASGETRAININGIIGEYIKWTATYISLIYACKRVVFQNYFENIKNEKIFNFLFRLAYICIYFGAVFSFVENTSSWIGIRLRYMGMFPLPFVIAKLWSLEKNTNNWIKAIIVFSLIAIIFNYAFTYKPWM